MFRAAVLSLAVLLAGPALAGDMVKTEPIPAAHADKAKEYLANSVKLEVDALSGLVKAMGDIIEKKGAEVPDDIKKSHTDALAIYKEAKALGEAKDFAAGYGKLREAWATHKPATLWFADKAEGETLKMVAEKLVKMVGSRAADLEEPMKKAPAAAQTQFANAKAKYADAKAKYDAGEGRKSFEAALDAIRELDDALHTTWKAAS